MPRIIIEKDAIEDIKNKLDSLIQRGQKIDSTEFRKIVRQRTGFLDENEKLVFKWTIETGGCRFSYECSSSELPFTNTGFKCYQKSRI